MVDNILSGAFFNLSGLPLQIESQILCCILYYNSNKKTLLFGIAMHNTITVCEINSRHIANCDIKPSPSD